MRIVEVSLDDYERRWFVQTLELLVRDPHVLTTKGLRLREKVLQIVESLKKSPGEETVEIGGEVEQTEPTKKSRVLLPGKSDCGDNYGLG